jgi:hypothetical protein
MEPCGTALALQVIHVLYSRASVAGQVMRRIDAEDGGYKACPESIKRPNTPLRGDPDHLDIPPVDHPIHTLSYAYACT